MEHKNIENAKPKLITQSTVLSMGFTKSMIEKLLPEPILKDNPHYKCSSPMKLWEEQVVLAAMETPEYKQMRESGEKRRASAQKAVETKKLKAEEVLDELLASLTVRVIDILELEKITLKEKQAWYNSNCYDGFDFRNAYSADELTLQRWQVNYIRHNLCQYDKGLMVIFGKTGKRDLFVKLKKTVLEKISEAYPYLADECERQSRRVDVGHINSGFFI